MSFGNISKISYLMIFHVSKNQICYRLDVTIQNQFTLQLDRLTGKLSELSPDLSTTYLKEPIHIQNPYRVSKRLAILTLSPTAVSEVVEPYPISPTIVLPA